jgi:hypothetical protein
MSLILLFCWMLLVPAWRQSRMLKRNPDGYPGPFFNVWPGIPAAISGGTLFVVAGWIIYFSGSSRGDTSEPRKVLIFALVAGGLACFGWLLIAVSRSSRTSFGRPVSSSRRPLVPGGEAPDAAGIAEFMPRAGERIVGEYPTNHLQGSMGRGGHLLLTSERLIFTPVAASAARGARPWQADLQGILKADVAPRGSNPFDGSLRRRLRVTDASGHADYFVVWRPGKLAGIVNSLR